MCIKPTTSIWHTPYLHVGNTGYLEILGTQQPNITLRQIMNNLKKAYCSR
jgi:hypothetical protein